MFYLCPCKVFQANVFLQYVVLLGKDLGPTFHKFMTMAVAKPLSVKLTRAQSEALLAEEAERSAQQLADEGTPRNLNSISDSHLSTSDEPPSVLSSDQSALPASESITGESELTVIPAVSNLDSVHSLEETVPNPSSEPALEPTVNSNKHDSSSVTPPPSDHIAEANPSNVETLPDSELLFSIPTIGFDGISKKQLVEMQAKDDNLAHIREWANNGEKKCFYVDSILMCLTTNHGKSTHVVVLPQPLRNVVLKLAHNHSGHFGAGITRAIINVHFTWPGLYSDVREYVKRCKTCQQFSKASPARAPLSEPELICQRFEKLAIDVVGPLGKSCQGYRYTLTALDLATNFSFAMPMRGYSAEETSANLLKIISVIGIPAAILSDQGQNFMSRTMDQLCSKLAINKIRTSPYHPETNGQLERLHSTLKAVLRKITENKRDWPQVLDLTIYYLRHMPHSRHGLTPYELVFGKTTPNVIATLKAFWTDP